MEGVAYGGGGVVRGDEGLRGVGNYLTRSGTGRLATLGTAAGRLAWAPPAPLGTGPSLKDEQA